jgi:hypothetical protein
MEISPKFIKNLQRSAQEALNAGLDGQWRQD